MKNSQQRSSHQGSKRKTTLQASILELSKSCFGDADIRVETMKMLEAMRFPPDIIERFKTMTSSINTVGHNCSFPQYDK